MSAKTSVTSFTIQLPTELLATHRALEAKLAREGIVFWRWLAARELPELRRLARKHLRQDGAHCAGCGAPIAELGYKAERRAMQGLPIYCNYPAPCARQVNGRRHVRKEA